MGCRIARDKYEMARQRVLDGRWRVDPESGQVYGRQGKAIGYVDAGKYVRIALSDCGRTRDLMRDRIVWEATFGTIGDDFEVSHRGDRGNDAVSNLYLVCRRRSAA